MSDLGGQTRNFNNSTIQTQREKPIKNVKFLEHDESKISVHKENDQGLETDRSYGASQRTLNPAHENLLNSVRKTSIHTERDFSPFGSNYLNKFNNSGAKNYTSSNKEYSQLKKRTFESKVFGGNKGINSRSSGMLATIN